MKGGETHKVMIPSTLWVGIPFAFLLILFGGGIKAFGQTAKTQYRAVYELRTKHNIPGIVSPDLWIVDVDGEVLRFYSHYTERRNSVRDSILNLTNNVYEAKGYVDGMKKGATDRYLFFLKDRKVRHILGDLNRVYYEEQALDPLWKIAHKSKKVLTYNSQEATTEYGGRSWVVYYTDEIPMPYGPWKLHGLTGLITEAYTTDSLFHFTLKGFETVKMFRSAPATDPDKEYTVSKLSKKEALGIRKDSNVDPLGALETQFLEGPQKLPLNSKYQEKVKEREKAYEYFEK